MDGPGAFLFTPDEMEMWAQGEQFMAWQAYLIAFQQHVQNTIAAISANLDASGNRPGAAVGELNAMMATTPLTWKEYQLAGGGGAYLQASSRTWDGSTNGTLALGMLADGEVGVDETLTTHQGNTAFSATLVDGSKFLWLSARLVGSGFAGTFVGGSTIDMAQTLDHEMYHLYGPTGFGGGVYGYSAGPTAEVVVDLLACRDIPGATRC